MGTTYKCDLCGNEDPKYFGELNGKIYCRRCISFKGDPVDDSLYKRKYKGQVSLGYKLSKVQEEIATKTLECYKRHEDVLIYAVCGAGKTELVFKTIEYALKKRLSVGFAIPRKDVVIELARRLQSTFSQYVVTSVYGGNTSLLNGDIICLTTHQLFRYEKFFDLLILDEIDAFPYRDNEVLEALFKRSVRGNYIMMSATPSEKQVNEFRNTKGKNLMELYTRYHKNPIPLPKIKLTLNCLMSYHVLKNLRLFLSENKSVFIFTPTIEECEILFKMLNIFAKHGNFVHSKRKDRNEIIDDFRLGKYKYLVTTAVLERGVTVKNLQVIIFNASNKIYSKESLIQISGRVGRVVGATSGEIIYIADSKSEAMVESIREIERANTYL